MFILWGWGTAKRTTRYTAIDSCGLCKNPNQMQIIKVYSYFSLFLIPIITWSKKYFVLCPVCGASKQITKEQFMQIKNGSYIATPPTTQVGEVSSSNNVTELEQQILNDINYMTKSVNNLNSLDDNQFNQFYANLKNSLTTKYNNEDLVNKVLKQHFNM